MASVMTDVRGLGQEYIVSLRVEYIMSVGCEIGYVVFVPRLSTDRRVHCVRITLPRWRLRVVSAGFQGILFWECFVFGKILLLLFLPYVSFPHITNFSFVSVVPVRAPSEQCPVSSLSPGCSRSSVVARGTAGQRRAIDPAPGACFAPKIHLLIPVCPRPSVAFQC